MERKRMNKKRRWRVRERIVSFPDPQQDMCMPY